MQTMCFCWLHRVLIIHTYTGWFSPRCDVVWDHGDLGENQQSLLCGLEVRDCLRRGSFCSCLVLKWGWNGLSVEEMGRVAEPDHCGKTVRWAGRQSLWFPCQSGFQHSPMVSRVRSCVKAAKISFPWRVAEPYLRDGVRRWGALSRVGSTLISIPPRFQGKSSW